MSGAVVFSVVAVTGGTLFTALVVAALVLGVRTLVRREQGWQELAGRRGWHHAPDDVLSVGPRLHGRVSRTLWTRLSSPAGPLVVGVVASHAYLRAPGLTTTLPGRYAAPAGVALVDLRPEEVARVPDAAPPGLHASHADGLLVLEPRRRLRPQGLPPTAEEAEALLDAVVGVLQRAMPSR